ncbi:MAG: hypothetical protein PVI20_20545 [Desulfobacteraceae bacterium]|jgi:hypothetical protein
MQRKDPFGAVLEIEPKGLFDGGSGGILIMNGVTPVTDIARSILPGCNTGLHRGTACATAIHNCLGCLSHP